MPEEILAIIIISIVSGSFLAFSSMILNHRRKMKGSQTSDNSMTTSELESMMRKAVDDATAPLRSTVEDLELEVARMQRASRQLPEHDASTRISLDEQDEVLDVEPVRASRRDRS